MLTRLAELRLTPTEIEARFAIKFEDWFERGLGPMKLARIRTRTGVEFLLSQVSHSPGQGTIIEGWLEDQASPRNEEQLVELLVALGLNQSDIRYP